MNDISKLQFQRLHELIINDLASLSDDQLSTSFEGKWSILLNIAHLGRYQEIYEMRIHAILTGHQPQFNRYEAEQDAQWLLWQSLSKEQLIDKVRLKRRLLWEEISQLTEEQLGLTGIHPQLGKLTLQEWTSFFLLHEAHHHYRIFRIIHEFIKLKV